MKHLLRILVLLVATIAAAPQASVPDRLAEILIKYHGQRVDSAHIHKNENEEERQARIRIVAEQIDIACNEHPFDVSLGWTHVQCDALASAAAQWESGLLEDVHSGAKRGPAGERCLFQLHRYVSAVPNPKYRVTPEELVATTGTGVEATHTCAVAGVKTLGWQIHRCRLRAGDFVSAAAAFSLYHHPTVNCEYVLSGMPAARARSYRGIEARLRSAG